MISKRNGALLEGITLLVGPNLILLDEPKWRSHSPVVGSCLDALTALRGREATLVGAGGRGGSSRLLNEGCLCRCRGTDGR